MTPHERFETLTVEAMRQAGIARFGLSAAVPAGDKAAGQLARYDDEDEAAWSSSYPLIVR